MTTEVAVSSKRKPVRLPVFMHRMVRSIVQTGERLPGVWRLRHWVSDTGCCQFPEHAVRTTLINGYTIWVRPNDPIGRSIFYRGLFEPTVATRFQKLLRPGDVVLDAGANIGQYTLLASKIVGPTGRVFAVEPGSECLKLLNQSVLANQLSNVTIFPYAGWDSDRTLSFVNVREDILGWAQVRETTNQPNEIHVEAKRLDRLLQVNDCSKIDIIKIDVEGAELPLFRGMESFFQNHPPRAILSEVATEIDRAGGSAKELIDWLAQYGYTPWEIEEEQPRPFQRTDLDTLFNRNLLFLSAGEKPPQ